MKEAATAGTCSTAAVAVVRAVAEEEDEAKKKAAQTNIKLLLLFVHGLGVLLGFYLFSSMYRTQCSTLLATATATTTRDGCNNATVTVKALSSLRESENSEELSTNKEESSTSSSNALLTRQLLEQLEQRQTAMVATNKQQEKCLAMHEAALVRVSTAQREQTAAEASVAALHRDMQRLLQTIRASQEALEDTKRWAEKQQKSLSHQLELAKTMIQEKVDEVEQLKSSLDADANANDTFSKHTADTHSGDWHAVPESMAQMQAAVQRRSMAMTVESFGEPPYTVQFMIKGGGTSSSSDSDTAALSTFTVQFGNEQQGALLLLREFPHTIHTFLTLVEAGLYHETSLQVIHQHQHLLHQGGDGDSDGHTIADAKLTGGSPASSVRKQVQSKLMRKYAELGYSAVQPLLFTETKRSAKTTIRRHCGAYSFHFVNHGPDFEIHLLPEQEEDEDALADAADDETDTHYPCFGRVVTGKETLRRLQQQQQQGQQQRLTIIDARIVQSAHHHRDEEDEL